MMLFLFTYYFIFFIFSFLLIIFFIVSGKEKYRLPDSTPFVSVLIAARNEENNILDCLSALEKLSYPKNLIEIIIGNDNSTDNTKQIAEDYIKGKDIFRLIDVKSNFENLQGKANVLAHLAKEARGEYLFITDADIEVQPNWIQGLLKRHEGNTGIVSGSTFIKGESFGAKMQNLEWIFAFGMIKVVSDLNIPVSAVGNNMVISHKAYESTGGYENIPFSITEDFELFKATLNKGWGYKNLLEEDIIAYSKPVKDLYGLLKQRKRWMTGAYQLPFILVLCLFIQSMFFPVILITIFLYPLTGLLILLLKIISCQVFIGLILKKIRQPLGVLMYVPLFEIYKGLLSFLMLIYHILPFKVEWKGRKY
ncbi:MAG: glycosyltransferase [Cytophagaceae bacterium]|nr:glycosyltransferase [Cytophagaceae bacterium]